MYEQTERNERNINMERMNRRRSYRLRGKKMLADLMNDGNENKISEGGCNEDEDKESSSIPICCA